MTFQVGDKVSWNIGSDTYVGVVSAVSETKVTVLEHRARASRSGMKIYQVFTRRKDGNFRVAKYNFGTLHLGGEEYMDPSF